jgi:hypothetical protein
VADAFGRDARTAYLIADKFNIVLSRGHKSSFRENRLYYLILSQHISSEVVGGCSMLLEVTNWNKKLFEG